MNLFSSMTRFLVIGAVLTSLAMAEEGQAPKKKPPLGKPDKDGWISLFDGKSLGHWKIVDEPFFEDHGKISIDQQQIILEDGSPATGIKWIAEFPKMDYEVALEARRLDGNDFFCGMTFPVGDKWLTLVCGGWGGQVTGLSSIDEEPAVENETCTYQEYEAKRWYRIRLRVQPEKIQAWLDDEQIVDLPTKARQFSIYWEMEPCRPFGICTWYTDGALRNLRVRRLAEKPGDSQEPQPTTE